MQHTVMQEFWGGEGYEREKESRGKGWMRREEKEIKREEKYDIKGEIR